MQKLTKTFVANDKVYRTDAETFELMQQARETKNEWLLGCVFTCGQDFGCVVEDAAATARYLAQKVA